MRMPGLVYYFWAPEVDWIKVGRTLAESAAALRERRRSLRGVVRFDLVLVGVERGGLRKEQAIHGSRRFRPVCITPPRGEWYRASEALWRHIEQNTFLPLEEELQPLMANQPVRLRQRRRRRAWISLREDAGVAPEPGS